MKTQLRFIFFSLFIFSTLFLADASAQDYTQLSLPEGATARLGKDRIWQLETAMFVDPTTGSVTFAVGNNDGTISIQNGYTGHQIRKLMVQTDDSSSLPLQSPQPYTYKNEIIDGQPAMKWINDLHFSPDGKTLVNTVTYRIAHRGESRRRDGPTEIWDVDTGAQLAVLPNGTGIEFLGDSKTLAITRHRASTIWDTTTHRKIAAFKSGWEVAFSGDGKTLAVGTRNHDIQLWNITTLHRVGILKGHKHVVCELAFSPDDTLLASGDTGGNIHLWELPIGNHLTTYKGYEGHKDYIRTLTFAPDGKTLASINGHDRTILLWNVPNR